MNESVILVVGYEKICRLCLHSTSAMSDIFENNEGTSLIELIFNATGYKCNQDDGLPSKICHKCRYVVELSCELRDMVAKTHLLLCDAGRQVVQECRDEGNENLENTHSDTESNEAKYFKSDLKMENLSETSNQDMVSNFEPDEVENNNEYKVKDVNLATTKPRKAPPKHLTCQICLTTFITTEDVDKHVEKHYAQSDLTSYLKLKHPYKCEVCNRSMSKTQMIRHHRTHLNVNPFVCKQPGCGYVGKNQNCFRLHAISHSPRSVVCERCGLSFRRRFELLQHTARAHRPKPKHCAKCKKTFRNAVTFYQHLHFYHRERRYVCDWSGCTKAYHTRAMLAAHVRTHSDERLFKCHLCAAASYTSRSLLNRHLRMHERARKSKCDKCALTFDDYGAFYRHRVTEHGPWQPFRCVGCNLGYQTEVNLQKHMEACDKAIRMKSYKERNNDDNAKELLISTVEEMPECLQLDTVLKGQSLLVQPGNLHELGKHLVLQELPPDGLLYIEVDDEIEEEDQRQWKQ